MNFLSHYQLASQNDSPYYTLGVLLPDLIPGFTKLNKQKSIDCIYTVQEEEMIAGVAFHLKTDRVFHNLEIFHELTKQLTRVLTSNSIFKIPRSFFIAHVLVELLIDKFLVESNPEKATQFYSELDEIDIETLNIFLKKINYQDNNFISRFDNFKSRRFAFLLNSNENLFQALGYICFKRIDFSANDYEKEVILEQIDTCVGIVALEWENILHEMHIKLVEYDH